jgi:hypothetical protein
MMDPTELKELIVNSHPVDELLRVEDPLHTLFAGCTLMAPDEILAVIRRR